MSEPRRIAARSGAGPRRRRALVLVALIVVFGVAAAIVAQPRRHGRSTRKLLWAPGAMKAPVRVMLRSGLDPEDLRLSPSQDYILEMPPGGIHGTIEIDGGHDVTLIGGSVTVPSTANQTDNGADDSDTAIYVRDSTGTVHIEGVLIKADPNVEYDGIDINAPQATVQVENVRMEKLYGSLTSEHADAIQPWGGVKLLEVDNLTANGDYQGLTLKQARGRVGAADIHNADLTVVPRPAPLARRSVGGGVMVWLTPGKTCDAPATTFVNVYVDNESNRVSDADTIWPSRATQVPCAGVRHGARESWPRLPVRGTVTFGRPPGGSFVPAGLAGNGYRSPGYVTAPPAETG